MSKIISLSVQNLLRIKLAEVTPDGAVVIVAGANDQGKSSLLNSIAIALSGKDLPKAPIRSGAASGQVILTTEDLVITRRFTQTGGQSLEVRDAEGVPIKSPQAKLDALVSRVTFDPFEFTRMKPEVQRETVRKIVGLDFSALDKEHAEKYDARTALNRKVRDAEGNVRSIVRHDDAPAEEVSVASLTQEFTAAQAKNKENDAAREYLDELQEKLDIEVRARSGIRAEIDALLAKIKQLEAAGEEAEKDVRTATLARDSAKAEIVKLEDVPTEPIMARLGEVDATNYKVRANKAWGVAQGQVLKLKREAEEITDRLEAIEREKKEALGKVTFPVPGLGFDEQGVTYNGLPFEQAGTAVKIRTSVAIARSLNPALPVMLVRDGSLLDPESFKLLSEEAESQGLQIWVEVVSSRDDATVVIEDGEVIARPAAEKKKAKATSAV